MDTMAQRWDTIQARIGAACARAGRLPESVRVLPVSKTFGPESVREAAGLGFRVFGENRVQEARGKIPLCPGHLDWHLIGHLQRNKVREAVKLFSMIHSVDSLALLETIDRVAGEEGRTLPVLLEVNVSGEGSKFGVKPGEVEALVDAARKLFRVRIAGLMTIPPWSSEVEAARPYFQRLRELRDAVRDRTGLELAELSMGMSGDFEVAIEEGATWIRLGSLLFGTRPKRVVENE